MLQQTPCNPRGTRIVGFPPRFDARPNLINQAQFDKLPWIVEFLSIRSCHDIPSRSPPLDLSEDHMFTIVTPVLRGLHEGCVEDKITGTEACLTFRHHSFHLVFYSPAITRTLSAFTAQPTPRWGSPPSSVDQNQPPASRSDRHHAARPHRAMIIISRSLIVIMARRGQAPPWPQFSIRSVWL